MAFLYTISENLYYNESFYTHIYQCIQNTHGIIHSTHRLENIHSSFIDSFRLSIKQESKGVIIYSESIYTMLKQILENLIDHQQDAHLNIDPQKPTCIQVHHCCLHLYPENSFHYLNYQSTLIPSSEVLWIYPLYFDMTTSLLFLEPLCQTHGVTLTPINITQAHGAFIAKSPNQHDLADFVQNVIAHFGQRFFLTYNLTQSLHELLQERNQTLSTAESFTGGRIAHIITSYPGASKIFQGGMIPYQASLKKSWLNIPESFLQSDCVSEVVARSMAHHIIKSSNSYYSIATTGIAGPDGGSLSCPVGTVFIAVASKEGEENVQRIHFTGNRNHIQEQASHYALFLLLKMIIGN